MNIDVDSLLDSSKPAPPPPRLARSSLARRLLGRREVIMVIINVVFILIVSQLTPYFFYAGNGFANIRVLLVGMAMDTVVLAPMVMLLVGGMFDLSVDGVVNMTSVITGTLIAE